MIKDTPPHVQYCRVLHFPPVTLFILPWDHRCPQKRKGTQALFMLRHKQPACRGAKEANTLSALSGHQAPSPQPHLIISSSHLLMYSTELRDNNLTVNARQRRNQNSNLVYATSKGSLAYTAFSSERKLQPVTCGRMAVF